MKQTIFALLLACSLLLSACQGAATAPSSAPKDASVPEESSSYEGEKDLSPSEASKEPVEEESELTLEEDETLSAAEESAEEISPLPSKDQAPTTQPSLKDVYPISDEEVHAALSRPMEEILPLDNTAITWGPGPTSGEQRPATPLQLQQQYGELGAFFIAPEEPKIYLTFDEGYDAGYNGAILDTLREKNVSALFFVTLGFVQSRPDLVQRMVDEGHMLGNHSWKHIAFPNMDPMNCAKDVLYLHNYVKENFGYTMTVCRPPEGAFSQRTLALLDALGYQSMFWSFAYRDWILEEQPSVQEAFDTVVGRSHPGAIYLLHAVSSTNATILGDVIDALQTKGYEIAPWNG